MRKVGPVVGGAAAVVEAVREVIGAGATVVVPAQTAHNSTTSPSFREATRGLDPAGVSRYIATMQPFQIDRTPSRGMGVLAEVVRRHPRARRSAHPQTSFAAVGPRAEEFMADHELDSHLGPRSPLGALYRADAVVLMLGVGFSVCTAFHLAEYRQPARRERGYECVVLDDGKRTVRRFIGLDLCDADFATLGAEFAAHDGSVCTGTVGNATGRMMPLRRAVDFAVGWMGDHRRP